MKHRHAAWVAALSLSLVSLPALGASSKDKAQAKALVTEAKNASKDKRWADAVKALRKANDLDPSTQTQLDLARALSNMNKLVEATKILHDITGAPATTQGGKKVAEAAKKLATDLEAKIPWLQVTVGAGEGDVKTLVDDDEIDASQEVPLNPGEHRVAAEAKGYEPAEKTIKLEEGQHKKVHLKLERSSGAGKPAAANEPDAPSEGMGKAPALVAFALGAAGIGVGTAFGVMASSQTSDVKSHCDKNGVCPASVQDALDRAKSNGNVSTIAFIAGGVGVAAGVVLLVASLSGGKKAPEKEKSAMIQPWIGPTGAGVNGRF